jgi:hypothetical protein
MTKRRLRTRLIRRLVRSLVGTRVVDGGQPGTLERCHGCGGDGVLHRLDFMPPSPPPVEGRDGTEKVA